jgi:hypothetical protein
VRGRRRHEELSAERVAVHGHEPPDGFVARDGHVDAVVGVVGDVRQPDRAPPASGGEARTFAHGLRGGAVRDDQVGEDGERGGKREPRGNHSLLLQMHGPARRADRTVYRLQEKVL